MLEADSVTMGVDRLRRDLFTLYDLGRLAEMCPDGLGPEERDAVADTVRDDARKRLFAGEFPQGSRLEDWTRALVNAHCELFLSLLNALEELLRRGAVRDYLERKLPSATEVEVSEGHVRYRGRHEIIHREFVGPDSALSQWILRLAREYVEVLRPFVQALDALQIGGTIRNYCVRWLRGRTDLSAQDAADDVADKVRSAILLGNPPREKLENLVHGAVRNHCLHLLDPKRNRPTDSLDDQDRQHPPAAGPLPEDAAFAGIWAADIWKAGAAATPAWGRWENAVFQAFLNCRRLDVGLETMRADDWEEIAAQANVGVAEADRKSAEEVKQIYKDRIRPVVIRTRDAYRKK